MARRSATNASPRRSPRRAAPRGEYVLVSREALCAISGVSEDKLRIWEREDLIAPARIEESGGEAEPLYDRRALKRARVIRTLAEELEVNLAGISVILNLLDQMEH